MALLPTSNNHASLLLLKSGKQISPLRDCVFFCHKSEQTDRSRLEYPDVSLQFCGGKNEFNSTSFRQHIYHLIIKLRHLYINKYKLKVNATDPGPLTKNTKMSENTDIIFHHSFSSQEPGIHEAITKIKHLLLLG